MVNMIVSLMMFFCSIMISLNHPISLGFMILMQTILVCMLTRILTFSAWIPLSMFLVMVGGLMVVFTYVNSICSNSKFSFTSWKMTLFYMITPTYIIYTQPLVFNYYDNLQLKDNFNLEFVKLFLTINIYSSMFTFLYLLIALIIMINLIGLTKGPLRKKY
uniref:NADH dehydrogenase subunit 6 n=1 Tax=Bactericera cockerelli TaxID=290155 RepID=A0A166GKZ5_9HEMI|nr:NADH dehydrogenase subunit 6 [Bactericera cockerelli]ANA07534.1 NADH dehydrogenase subunit 6 [Bactericera cockerelli]